MTYVAQDEDKILNLAAIGDDNRRARSAGIVIGDDKPVAGAAGRGGAGGGNRRPGAGRHQRNEADQQ